MTSPDPNRRDRVPPPPPGGGSTPNGRGGPPPIQGGAAHPPPLRPATVLPPQPVAGTPAPVPTRPRRGSGAGTTLLTVLVGGGLIAGVVYVLLPKMEPVTPPVAVDQEPAQPPFAGVEPQVSPPVADTEMKPDAASGRMPESKTRPRTFAAVQRALTAAKHLPFASLDGTNFDAHEADLCDLGTVPIDLALPTARFPAERPLVLMCVPDAPTLAGGGQAWQFLAAEPGQEPVRIGGAEVREGRLVARLEPGNPQAMQARHAVSTAVLRIAERERPDQATYVQLRRPQACGPIVVRRLLSGEREGYGGAGDPLDAAVPPCPWACAVRLTGRCGDLVGPMTGSRPGAIVSAGTMSAVQWTTAWAATPGTELLASTTLAISGARGPRGAPAMLRVRRGDVRLSESWSSSRRMGRIGGRIGARGGIPDAVELETEIGAVSHLTLSQLIEGSVSGLQASLSGILTVARRIVRDELPAGRTATLEEWVNDLCGLLARRPEYQMWATGQTDRTAPGVAIAREYFARLQPAIEAGQANEEEAALCAMIDDLDRLGDEKRAAIALARSLGTGDATFTGSLAAEFADFVPGMTARCVLLTFAGEPAAAAAFPPPTSP